MLAAGIGEAALRTLGENQLAELAREGVWKRIHGLLTRALEGTNFTLNFGVVQLKPALHQGEGLKTNLRDALPRTSKSTAGVLG